jgi:putative hydrolase of the HAD superfamily
LPAAHWLDRFLALYRQTAGLDLTREELDPAFSYATRRGYQAGERIYAYGLRKLLGELVNWQIDYLLRHLPGRMPPTLRDAAGLIADRFCLESAVGFEHSRATLAKLARRYKIGVVSNFYGNLQAVLDEAELAPFVRAAIDSSRVGVFKPNPAIYLAALTQLDARAHETAMIGDSLSKDCVPARQLGLRTVWLAPESIEYTAGLERGADLVVHDLHQLVEICLGAD